MGRPVPARLLGGSSGSSSGASSSSGIILRRFLGVVFQVLGGNSSNGGSGYTLVLAENGRVDQASWLAVSGSYVYAAMASFYGPDSLTAPAGLVGQIPVSGGTGTTLVPSLGDPGVIAASPDGIAWTDASNENGSFEINAWVNGTLVNLAGSTAALGVPDGITIQGSNVYWTTHSPSSIMVAPLNGSASPSVLVSSSDVGDTIGPVPFLSDAQYLYFVNTPQTSIFRVPLFGRHADRACDDSSDSRTAA